MPPRRENPPQPPPPDGPGRAGQPQNAGRGAGPVPGPPAGLLQRAASALTGRGAEPGAVPRPPGLGGGIQPGFAASAVTRGVAGLGTPPGTPPRAGLGTPPPGSPAAPAVVSPVRDALLMLRTGAGVLGQGSNDGGPGAPPAQPVPAQQHLPGTPGDRGKRADEEYSSSDDPRERTRQRVDGASGSRTGGGVPQGQQSAAAGRSRDDWQREGTAVGIVRYRGEEEARRRVTRGGYGERHARASRAQARILQALPNADPANPLVNYGHRKWPIAMTSDIFYISVVMLDLWPRGLDWQTDTTHLARCQTLVQEFQQTGLPRTVHADYKHEDQVIPHPSAVTPAYKCACWKNILGDLWFQDTDASLLRKVGPDWGAENQNLFLHLLKRLLTGMTRHYIKNATLFITNNPSLSQISRTQQKPLWSPDYKQILTKVLEIKGTDRDQGQNWSLQQADKKLVSQLTGLEVGQVSKKLRGQKFMRDKKKRKGLGTPQNQNEEEEEGEDGDESEEDDQPQAQQPPPPNGPFAWTNEENYYWDSYLLPQRVLNPLFTRGMITPDIYTKFKTEVCRHPDHPQIDTKIATFVNHFLSRSRREAPRRGLKLCIEAIAAYNAIALKNGGAPYDPMNGANNNRDWCNIGVNTTLRLLRQRNEAIQVGAPGSPSDYEARDNAAMQAESSDAADSDDEEVPVPEAPAGSPGSPGTPPSRGTSPQRKASGQQVPAGSGSPVPAGSDSSGFLFPPPSPSSSPHRPASGQHGSGSPARSDSDGEGDSRMAELSRQLFVGPDSAAAYYQPILEERLQGPDNDPEDQINNLLGLSPTRPTLGLPPGSPGIPPPKPLPGPAGAIVEEFYADREQRMSRDPSEYPEPPEPPAGPEQPEPSPLEFVEMYDWVAANNPDMLKFIRWPERLKEFFYWINEKWPDMFDHIRWPRVNPTEPPDLPGDLAAVPLEDDDLNINLDDLNFDLDGGDGYPANPNINGDSDND